LVVLQRRIERRPTNGSFADYQPYVEGRRESTSKGLRSAAQQAEDRGEQTVLESLKEGCAIIGHILNRSQRQSQGRKLKRIRQIYTCIVNQQMALV
jgi:hypothetical protein